MQGLGDTLKVMRLQESAIPGPITGSGAIAGRTIIPPRLHEFPRPEMEKTVLARLRSLPSLRMTLHAAGRYGEGGYLGSQTIPEITSCSENDTKKATDFLQELMRPCREEIIVQELQKLSYKIAMRATDNEDWKLKLAAYVEELRIYPEHVIKAACLELVGVGFFPIVKEFYRVCSDRMSLIKGLYNAFNTIRTTAPAITSRSHYREVDRKHWQAHHFFQKVDDLMGFANVHRKNHKATDELEYLLTARKFIEEARAKFTEQEPEMLELYRLDGEAKSRAEVLEKRLAWLEDDKQHEAAE